MKKKIGAVLLAGVMACSVGAAFALAGCGGGGGNKGELVVPETGFDTSKPVTISFSHTMGQKLREVLKPCAEKFMALYPNVTITNLDEARDSNKYEELYSMISKQIIAGTEPNIAYCYSDHVAGYNAAGAVQTLDDFLPGGKYADIEVTRADGTKEKLGLTQEQVDMFIPGYYNEGKNFGDGKMYTLPFSKSTEVLYYNKTAFEKNGWKVPTTWKEMEETCRAIKEDFPESIPLGYDSEANWFITMCEQYNSPYTSATGKHYLFDNQKNREFVEYFAGWYKDGLVTTQLLNNKQYTSNLFTQEEPNGKAYMCIGSTAGASYQQASATQGKFDFTVGITRIPQVDPEHPKVISQGPSVCIFKKGGDAQQVLASWLFIKYLTTSVDFQAEFSMASGYVPVLNMDTMSTNQIYLDLLGQADGEGNLPALSASVCMEQEEAYFTSPAFMGSAEARTQVGLLMQAVLANPSKLDSAFKIAIEECEQI